MSNRTIRINELLQREISDVLRKHYQSEAVAITINEVRVAPDLRDGRVFVGIIGTEEFRTQKFKWLRQQAPAIREEIGRRVVLKFLPKFEYVLDNTTPKAVRVLELLDQIEKPEAGQKPEERS
jgi:ribosome-binding factor A